MAIGRILFDMVKDYVVDRRNHKIGQKIRRDTLKKILYAPVNLFFDVTPIGKILEIFNGDIHVFEHMDGALWGMVEISAHFIVVFTSMFQFATTEVLIFLPLFFYAIYHISKPYLAIDNQLHRVGGTIGGPMYSYFYESMRGTVSIRAFG